jgi:hypothetical protein
MSHKMLGAAARKGLAYPCLHYGVYRRWMSKRSPVLDAGTLWLDLAHMPTSEALAAYW